MNRGASLRERVSRCWGAGVPGGDTGAIVLGGTDAPGVGGIAAAACGVACCAGRSTVAPATGTDPVNAGELMDAGESGSAADAVVPVGRSSPGWAPVRS